MKHREFLLPPLYNLEAVSIQVTTHTGPLTIISAYLRPNTRLQQDELQLIFTQNSTLLLGDLNSIHTYWGCRATNINGTRLLTATDNLNILISAHITPFYPSQCNYQPDILDIALSLY
uniref:Rna-directed dna polymerase from mobile element jockey-like protein n=1 Tax=Triatoma infestans TaxID=30076 RepID=A0A170V7L8_TRIIF